MPKANPQEKIQQWFIDRGSELLCEYVNLETKITYRCSICSAKTEVSSFQNLRRSNQAKCPFCSKKERLSFNKDKFSDSIKPIITSLGSKLLNSPQNTHSQIELKCSICSNTFSYHSWSSILRSNPKIRCKQCSWKLLSQQRLTSIEEIDNWFRSKNSERLSEFKGVDAPIDFKCSKCGAKSSNQSFHNLRTVNKHLTCRQCNIRTVNKHLVS